MSAPRIEMTTTPDLGPRTALGPMLQPTLMELSRPGRGGGKVPHPPADALDGIPADQRRRHPAALPELNEPEVTRHFVNLSHLNYSVDGGFYPLGSCTMKYNPKINEWAARLPGFAALHPLAPDAAAQGTLELLWELEQWLIAISGMKAVTLQPAAGAHGELTGILMIRAYHAARGDHDRVEVIVPDSSHGTNPATASMAGARSSCPTRHMARTRPRPRCPASSPSRCPPTRAAGSTWTRSRPPSRRARRR